MRIEQTTGSRLSRRRLLLVKTARKPSFSPARLSYLHALAGNLRDMRTSNSGTSERGWHAAAIVDSCAAESEHWIALYGE